MLEPTSGPTVSSEAQHAQRTRSTSPAETTPSTSTGIRATSAPTIAPGDHETPKVSAHPQGLSGKRSMPIRAKSSTNAPQGRDRSASVAPGTDDDAIAMTDHPYHAHPASTAASTSAGGTRGVGSTTRRGDAPTVEGRVEHPLSELPTTLAGMEDAFQRLQSRTIDTASIAQIVNEVRQYGPGAFRAGQTPVANNAELMERAGAHLEAYFQAIGMEAFDIAQLQHSTRASGAWYPSASIPINLIQYAIPPFLAATGHQGWGLGIAAMAAGLGFFATGMLQQPLSVLPSEHTAERQGPLISVDKERVNYKHYRPIAAAAASEQASIHRDAATRFVADISERLEPIARGEAAQANEAAAQHEGSDRLVALLGDGHRQELNDFLQSMSHEQRTGVRELAQTMLDSARQTHQSHQTLLSTEGAHHRQTLGARYQIGPRVARPVVQGALGFLSGVNAENLEPAEVAEKLAQVGRMQQLPPAAVAAIQVAWLLVVQALQHTGAAFDETSKVTYKAMLDIAFADVLTPEGAAKRERGDPVAASDINESACRARVLGPVQALAKRVEKVLQREIAASGNATERATLQTHLALVRAGRFTQLPADSIAARMMLQASRQGIFRSMFNSDSALHHSIAEKANLDENKVQWTQRGTQTWHLLAFGSAVSSMSARIATAAYGGAGNTPTGLLAGILVLNVVLSVIAAISAAETQTLKNFGKEGEVPMRDPEGGTTARKPTTASQIGHGMRSGVDLVAGKWNAAQANADIVEVLQQFAAPEALAGTLIDLLDGFDTGTLTPPKTK